MNYHKINIEEIKRQGFQTINFTGYGGTGYKKGDLQIWWHEWEYAYIKLLKNEKVIHKIDLCEISTEPIADKLKKALKEMTMITKQER